MVLSICGSAVGSPHQKSLRVCFEFLSPKPQFSQLSSLPRARVYSSFSTISRLVDIVNCFAGKRSSARLQSTRDFLSGDASILRKGASTKTCFLLSPFYSATGSYRVLSVCVWLPGDEMKARFEYREVGVRLDQVRGQVLQTKPKTRPWRTTGHAPVKKKGPAAANPRSSSSPAASKPLKSVENEYHQGPKLA
jgi:hypothetical protein